MKRLWLILLIIGLLLVFLGVSGPVAFMLNSSQGMTGIIGGADMPTYLFLSSTASDGVFSYLLAMGACLVTVALIWRASSKKRRDS